MTRNDQKIKEILELFCGFPADVTTETEIKFNDLMKEYAEYILQQAIETIQNIPIETVGNSAQTIEQVIKDLNKLKE